MNPVLAARRRLNELLFEKVAGPDGDAARRRIHLAPGPRTYTADDPVQRVHGDASMYVGGLRALLLQSLHPLAMAAVADYTDYRGDPWGRLASTSTFIAETTFGRVQDAERALDVVRAVHARIAGTAPDGRPYRADDPRLLTWIHVAEIDSFLTSHQLYGQRPLTAKEADTYVAQAAPVAVALGAEHVPTSRAELDTTIEDFRPELTATAAALDAADFLLRQPPVQGLARLGYGVIARAAVASLPRWARTPLQLSDHPRRDATIGRAVGELATRSLRWIMGGDDLDTSDEAQPADDADAAV